MKGEEFRSICEEVLGVDKQTGKRKGFPDGCESCDSTIEWDCWHIENDGTEYLCPWRENYWKYDELKKAIMLDRYRRNGLDLNRIDSIELNDFAKLAILEEYL